MINYRRCTICGNFGWTGSHVCPEIWRVFEIDGNDIGYEREIRAESAEDAAIKYATLADAESAEYNFATHGGTVLVSKAGIETVEIFNIEGWMEPQYEANNVANINEKILESYKTYIEEE